MKKADNISENTGKMKKRIIIIIIAVIGIMLLLFVMTLIAEKILSGLSKEDEQTYSYNFYPADYEENIFTDSEYIEKTKEGFIYYCDSYTNITTGIYRENYDEYSDDLKFLIDYIYFMIYGDAEGYNNCYSDKYYDSHSPIGNFTMQKIYDVYITKQSEADVISDDGTTYTQYNYVIEYKILKNNGTLRNDIGSGSKKQYITMSDSTGKILIDSVSISRYS